jgi:hypothetical protein
MKARQGSRIGQIFADGRQIDEALRLAARDAIRKHALHDAPVVIWRDGRTAWVPAQEPARTPTGLGQALKVDRAPTEQGFAAPSA